ncbi:alpha-amylase family glycosyl hydrolase [Jiangella asiatica]|uniref:alpha-amylase family glycosyl hydrolase n=1 Tax=Jiangella asiatica TaxID=2530372 RepID=UPI0013A5EDBC|nr:alpha-amylase family glycosyl hydrolase [Jiangella asiatica]
MTTLPIEDPKRVAAPEWTRDLVIYELNPRGFTSPDGAGDGHGSGTFRSTAERLPYLADLGVTAIWLAGFHEATAHFYGIWSTYAASRFDRVDPALGTMEDFDQLIRTAHRHGIKVLVDVIAHGVLRTSALVAEHPDWFLPDGTWGMRDFDYAHPEFRAWWIDLWSSYVTEHGVDGFRVDVDMYDVTVWDEIARRAESAGHPILIMPENGRYHVGQRDWSGFSPDIAAEWNANRHRFTTHQISCHDEGWSDGPGSYYALHGSRARFGYSAAFSHRIPLIFAGEEFDATQVNLPAVRRGLFGAGGPGGWLYGCQVPWRQLEEDPARRAFHTDVRRILAIRREHRDVLNADRWVNDMVSLAADPAVTLVPYARFRAGEKTIVVAGNEAPEPLSLRVRLPLDVLGLTGRGPFQVVDAWNGGTSIVDERALSDGIALTLGPDTAPGGGLAVLVITLA